MLKPGVSSLLEQTASTVRYELLYNKATRMCSVDKSSARLYDSVRATIAEHLRKVVDENLVPLMNELTPPAEFIKAVGKIWSRHCLSSRLISDIFTYLDRTWVGQSHIHVPLTYDLSMMLFRKIVLDESQAGERLYASMLEEVKRERDGEMIDRLAMKNSVFMLSQVPGDDTSLRSVYETTFLDKLRVASEKYYEETADKFFDSVQNAVAYMEKTEGWLQADFERCQWYFTHPATLPLLEKTVRKILVTDRIGRALDLPNGFDYWVDTNNEAAFALLYRLVVPVDDGKRPIVEHLSSKLERMMNDLNSQTSADMERIRTKKVKKGEMTQTSVAVAWVDRSLSIKKLFDRIVASCFKGDQFCQDAVEVSFEKTVNLNSKCAEYLALCLDERLRKSAKGKSTNDVSAAINDGIQLFRYVRDKDRFESLYRLHLAKRLLNARSSSEEVELSFVEKLKEVQGTNFTTNLAKMFIDMRKSRELQAQFRTARHNGEIDVKFDVNVNVLRQNFWPSSTASSYTCVLPEPFADARAKFEKFYATKHAGHVLKWAYHVGSADVRVHFKTRSHDVNLPTVSMAVLMQFADMGPGEFLTAAEIQERTQVPMPELSRHLLSIAVAPNTRILKKEPMSRVVNPDDKFYFNENFESPMARIKVLVVSASSKPDPEKDRSVTDKEVEQSRMHETDAAIVRVMKARRTTDHANLTAEVTSILKRRFNPDPANIKRRIEALLEREYMRRDDDQRNVYHYIA